MGHDETYTRTPEAAAAREREEREQRQAGANEGEMKQDAGAADVHEQSTHPTPDSGEAHDHKPGGMSIGVESQQALTNDQDVAVDGGKLAGQTDNFEGELAPADQNLPGTGDQAGFRQTLPRDED